jgi:hypothetical protein
VSSVGLLRRFNNGTRACDLRVQLEVGSAAVGVLLYIYPSQGGFVQEELWLYPTADGPRDPDVMHIERRIAERSVWFLASQPTSEHLSLVATVPTHRAGVYDVAYRLSRCSDIRCGGGHSLVLVTADGLTPRELLRVDAPYAITFDGSGGRLTLRWVEARPGDPSCCPSLDRVRVYERSDTGYRLVSDTTTARTPAPSATP